MPGRAGGLASLERKLRLKFLDQQLLLQALTHRSYAHEHAAEGARDNERLEFLGDAVLELIAADVLYRRGPDAAGGGLALCRAAGGEPPGRAAAGRRVEP